MSTTDVSGTPISDIDQEKGPSTGSNAESPGGTLVTATTPIKSGNAPSDQGSSGTSSSNDNKGGSA